MLLCAFTAQSNGSPLPTVVEIPTDSLVIEVNSTNVTCVNNDNGTASLNILSGTPPFAVAWSNGSTASILKDLSPGTYTVTVTDSHGCVGSSSLPISIYPLSTEDLKSTNLSLYPNPTNGLVQVQLNELSGSDMIKILDMQGRVVLTQRISNSSTQLDLSELSSGTYTVRLSSDVEITEKSIIKR